MGRFPRAQAADELHYGCGVGMEDGPVDIDPHFVGPKHELLHQRQQQLILADVVLENSMTSNAVLFAYTSR